MAFSPDGASLAAAGYGVVLRTIATRATRVLDKFAEYPRQIAWSPDGRVVALADWRGAVRLYDPAGGEPRVLAP